MNHAASLGKRVPGGESASAEPGVACTRRSRDSTEAGAVAGWTSGGRGGWGDSQGLAGDFGSLLRFPPTKTLGCIFAASFPAGLPPHWPVHHGPKASSTRGFHIPST